MPDELDALGNYCGAETMNTSEYENRVRQFADRMYATSQRHVREAWIAGLIVGFLLGAAVANFFAPV